MADPLQQYLARALHALHAQRTAVASTPNDLSAGLFLGGMDDTAPDMSAVRVDPSQLICEYPIPSADGDVQASSSRDLFRPLKLGWKSVETRRQVFTDSAKLYCSAITQLMWLVREMGEQESTHEAVAVYCSAVEAEEAQGQLTRGVEEGLGLTDVCPVDQLSVLLREVKDTSTGLQDELEKLYQLRGNLTSVLERKVQAELGQRLRRLRQEQAENERAAAAAHRASVEAEKQQAREEAKACHICIDRPHNVILLPCVHAHFCIQCVEKLRTASKPCPTCRTSIMSTLEYKM